MQKILRRLRHLQTWFQQVESSQELVDAMQEGGHILEVIVRDQHLPADGLLPGVGEMLADYVSQALADRRKANPMEREGLAKFTQRALWELVAMAGTDQQRLLMHPPAEIEPGILKRSTDYQKNYRRQGKQFALLAGELLEKLEAIEQSVQSSGKTNAGASASGGPGRKSKVGRPRKSESREERRIREAWESGVHGSQKICDIELGIAPGTTKKTLDRLRNRKQRRREKADEMDETMSSDVEQEK